MGHVSTLDYVAAAAGAVLRETGLLPHINAGGRASAAGPVQAGWQRLGRNRAWCGLQRPSAASDCSRRAPARAAAVRLAVAAALLPGLLPAWRLDNHAPAPARRPAACRQV